MIQILIIILLVCLLIYALYAGINKSYTISPYDLNSSGLMKSVTELKSNYNSSEEDNIISPAIKLLNKNNYKESKCKDTTQLYIEGIK